MSEVMDYKSRVSDPASRKFETFSYLPAMKAEDIRKQVEYLVFENEGHDVLKYENRIKCYTEITEFFKKYLKP